MDFFATGGFQQLFSDLHEQQVDLPHELYSTYDDSGQIATANIDSCCRQHYDICGEECGRVGTTHHEDYQHGGLYVSDSSAMDKENDYFDKHSTRGTHMCSEDKENKLKTLQNCQQLKDSSNNAILLSVVSVVNEQQLQRGLDFLLPQDAKTDYTLEEEYSETYTELYANALITSEVADWEEKFLDNYIEIPELIEFLPDKTPLCTEMCELFLHESTKNLQLSPKVKSPASCDPSTFTDKLLFEDKSFPCTFGDCQKIYAKPAHLKAHLRRHLGEKPYICNWPECTWRFSRSDELARHRRSHSGVKPYKCVYCTKGFARSDHLTKHRKVHERRMLAASQEGKNVDGVLPPSVFTVRPGRKRKNQS